MIKTHCHCGNVTIQLSQKPTSVTSCNCSICHRYASLWAYDQPENVSITCTKTPTLTYRWGDEYIDFHFCPICSCVTHYTMTAKSEKKHVGVNMRMADPEILESIPIRKFDGRDTWTFVDSV